LRELDANACRLIDFYRISCSALRNGKKDEPSPIELEFDLWKFKVSESLAIQKVEQLSPIVLEPVRVGIWND